MAGGILPQRPTPGGLLGTGNLGAPSGPQPGQARGIPQNTPGPTVPGVPDPDKLVELFTAYTSGQVTREDLISQLATFSEGEGGILGLLEGMEKEEPNQMNGVQPNVPVVPVQTESLDQRHQRISQLLQGYGVVSDDADQMSTELNPMMGGRTVSQEQVDAAIESYNTQYPHAPVTGNTLSAIQSMAKNPDADYADMAGTRIGQIMGGIPGTKTGLFPNISAGQDIMSVSSQSPVFQPAAKPTHTHDNFPAHDTSIVHPEPKQAIPKMQDMGPRETGELVYDEETGQMVDSGTWMPPKPKQASSRPDTSGQPKETGELIWAEELQQMVDSGTYAPPVPKASVVPNEFDEGLGEVTPRTETTSGSAAAERTAWEEYNRQQAQWAGGGSIGDAATGAESAERDAMWAGGGSVGDMAANAELQRRTAPTTYSPDTTGKVIPTTGGDQTQEGFITPQPDVIPPEPEGGGRIKGLAQMQGGEVPQWFKDWFNVGEWAESAAGLLEPAPWWTWSLAC